MGALRKTIEPQNPGNFPGPKPEVVKRHRVAKERAEKRVRSWTVQNEMRGALGRVSAGAARRILDSVNSRGKLKKRKSVLRLFSRVLQAETC